MDTILVSAFSLREHLSPVASKSEWMIERGVSPKVQSQPRRNVGAIAGTIDVRMHCTAAPQMRIVRSATTHCREPALNPVAIAQVREECAFARWAACWLGEEPGARAYRVVLLCRNASNSTA
jgi:hypothetical protein